jgi:hypothetical protein
MTPRIARSLRLLPLAFVLAACADRSPVGGGTDPVVSAPTPSVALACRVSVAAGTVHCAQPAPATGGASGNLVVGGQNQYVRLVSSGVAYDSGTAILRADVTLQNLMPQPLGTFDGTTPAAGGVRVFFQSGPTVTSGTGTVTVANADGSDVFTAGSQPYFRYEGILHPEQTSAAKEWRFNVPATVGFFEFTVLVSAPHPAENGYVTVTPQHPSIRAGATRQLAAVVRSGAGAPQDGAVQWSSSNPSVATVSAAGVVTGVAAGTTTITASSGGRSGSTAVTVGSGQGDDIPPTLTGFSLPVDSVDVTSKADSAVVVFTADDDGSPIGRTFARLRSPGGGTITSTSGCTRTSGTETAGTWECVILFPQGAEPGTWKVEQVALEDFTSHNRFYTTEQLRAGGWPYTVQVVGPAADTRGPSLTGFSIDPDSVDVSAGDDTVRVTISATDASDITRVFARFRSASGELILATSGCALQSGTARAGTWSCDVRVPRYVEAGMWTVEQVVLEDQLGHATFISTAQLASAGYERMLRVASSPSDNSAPLLTGFTFTPSTAHVSAAPDTVTITISGTDDVSGITSVSTTLRSNTGTTILSPGGCFLTSGSANAGTYTCTLVVPQNVERGTYSFIRVAFEDAIGRLRLYDTAALQSAGHPTTVTVQD